MGLRPYHPAEAVQAARWLPSSPERARELIADLAFAGIPAFVRERTILVIGFPGQTGGTDFVLVSGEWVIVHPHDNDGGRHVERLTPVEFSARYQPVTTAPESGEQSSSPAVLNHNPVAQA